MTWYPTQSYYPDTEPTSPCPILIMSSACLGSDKYKLLRHSFDSTGTGNLWHARPVLYRFNQHAQFCKSLVWLYLDLNPRVALLEASQCSHQLCLSIWCTHTHTHTNTHTQPHVPCDRVSLFRHNNRSPRTGLTNSPMWLGNTCPTWPTIYYLVWLASAWPI